MRTKTLTGTTYSPAGRHTAGKLQRRFWHHLRPTETDGVPERWFSMMATTEYSRPYFDAAPAWLRKLPTPQQFPESTTVQCTWSPLSRSPQTSGMFALLGQ